MMNHVPSLCLLAFSCSAFLTPLHGQPSNSSEQGFKCNARSTILVEVDSPSQTETVLFAAEELRKYFSRILGRDEHWPQVRRNWSDRFYRIRLLKSSGAGALAPITRGLAPSRSVDEFQIQVVADSVTLTATNGSSLLHAVYQLLEEQGCRWLFPGPEGEIVPTRVALEIAGGNRGTRSDFSMRGLSPVENLQRYTIEDIRSTLDWMAKNRMNYFVPVVNYGWERLGKAVVEESRRRGINLVGYLWSFEVFLPLSLGEKHPEYFALTEGRRQVDYNIKRCASSAEAIQLYVENGRRWLRAHPELEELIIIPNDGYHWCECDRCRRLKPKDQWAAFFVPFWEKAITDNPRLRFHNFLYVNRYDLPDNIEPYRDDRIDHFFDVHQRNKWYSLRDPAAPVGGHREDQVDERSGSMALNSYLADRMQAWRSAARGRIWVFENLMLHATLSIPVPNLNLLAADLRAAHQENIQGYLFEAYLQGWNSFASDLWSLARLTWNTRLEAATLEDDFYRNLLGTQARKVLPFYHNFRASHLASARRCGLYWMHCVPEAARQYIESVRSIDNRRLNPAGRHWQAQQLRVADMMEEVLRRGRGDGSVLVASQLPVDTFDICRKVLETGRAMDGVVFAYALLQRSFMSKFPNDVLKFRPLLPATFDPEVHALFAHQKLWDTLAEWDSTGRFPRDPDDPDRWLREILLKAIDNGRTHFEK